MFYQIYCTVFCINEKNTNTMCFVIAFCINWTVSQDFRPFFNKIDSGHLFCTEKYKLWLFVRKIYKSSLFGTKIYFLFQFILILNVINVSFLQKRCKLLLFHFIFLLFCNCKRRIRGRKKEYMRQIGNERKKTKNKRKQLRWRIKIHWKKYCK